EEYRGYYAGFSMIRLMQALGAFGFRGLYEKKPTFTGSIVPAVALLTELVDSGSIPVDLNELFHTVRQIKEVKMFNELSINSIG
ncbi:MAG TPA: hypothetical protein VJ963_00180, partial [Bacteroidales bacterium]|nr:hypothetical protein [Bacteroidales bacterium]